ncbi:integrase [Pseudazoarcus pumilus]|uniref:Integrase n=2 Tax=Pseudazoarcus pumilus TaxID=2067960 RepID=A0A2I6S5V5_9RHOO|nr:integrase [Pseudazoarcus pumilus]
MKKMLAAPERMRLLDRLGLPVAGLKLITDAVRLAPVRPVASKGGGNVITTYQSRKMQRPIDTESRHIEFPAAVRLEHDPDVLEYYPQPFRVRMECIDSDGEIHQIDHTPDFLVIQEREIWVEEWKPHSKLVRLAQRYPWRYQIDPEGRCRAPLIEQWFAERGLGYRILSNADIPQRRIENILFLEDYLHPAAPACPIDVELAVRKSLAEQATMYLAELHELLDCRPDDLFKLIADGLLVAEIDTQALNEPTRCRVFRDTAVREFELQRTAQKPFELAGSFVLKPGAQITYDHQPYNVVMTGASHAVLEGPDGHPIDVPIETLVKLAARSDVSALEPIPGTERRSLYDFSEKQLRDGLKRAQALEVATELTRTQRRHLGKVLRARIEGVDERIALIPRTHDRGNRTSRLTDEQEAAIEQVLREEHLTSRAPNAKHCHNKLQALCAQRGIKAPSYPTLIARIKALSQQRSDAARHGSRRTYQNAEFVDVLHVDTPVHGTRPFQYVHMDHTQIDIELVCSRTGVSLGRPWLSFAIDAFTRRILGVYLSYDSPSYRSNMMLLRDIVRRHQRLPQFIVVDNGADFRSENFGLFAELMGIYVRYRPAGQPRMGSVMERVFGTANSVYVHNLAGNTKALRNVRTTTGKFLPSRLAEWDLNALYLGIEYWAFEHYDTTKHATLGVSPRDAFERSMKLSGQREHRIVTLTQDFLILSCPLVSRGGTRKVDRQRGIKLNNNFYFWCPEFRDTKLHGVKVPVRYDPWDCSKVFVQVTNRWVAAHCRALASLRGLTEKERELISNEMLAMRRVRENEEITAQRLVEFMRTFTPAGAVALALERQQANRDLYQDIGIGAVAVRDALPPIEIRPSDPAPSAHPEDNQAAMTPATNALPHSPDKGDAAGCDIPDFDTF